MNKAQYILRLMEQATYVYEDDYKDNTTFMKRHGGALSAAALGVAGGAAAYYGMKHGLHLGGGQGGGAGSAVQNYVPTPKAPSVMPSLPTPKVPDTVPSPGARAAEFVAPTKTAGLSGGRAGASQAQRAIQQMAKDAGETTAFSPSDTSASPTTSVGPANPLTKHLDKAMGHTGVERPKGPLQGELPGGTRQEIPRAATLQGSKEVDAEFKASLGAGAPPQKNPFAKYNIR